MATPFIVTADTSIVQVDTIANLNPVVLLPSIAVPGVLITIRDSTGNASPSNQVYVSTVQGITFTDFTSFGGTTNLYTINQPYGSITVTPQTSSRWSVTNTFAFSAGQSSATISNLSASGNISSTTMNAGSGFISTLLVNNLTTTAPYLALNTITTTSTIYASTVKTGATLTSSIGVGMGPAVYPLDVSGTARVIGNTLLFGKVGINCNSPQVALDVNGDVNIRSTLTIQNSGTAATPGIAIRLSNAYENYIQYDTGDNAWYSGTNPNNSLWPPSALSPSSFIVGLYSGNGQSTAIVATSLNQVGINCNIPRATLDVNGSINCSTFTSENATFSTLVVSSFIRVGSSITVGSSAIIGSYLSTATWIQAGTYITSQSLSTLDATVSSLAINRALSGSNVLDVSGSAYIGGPLLQDGILTLTGNAEPLKRANINWKSPVENLQNIQYGPTAANIWQAGTTQFAPTSFAGTLASTLILGVHNVAGNTVPAIVATTSNQVGINTGTPRYTLDVNGSAYSQSTITSTLTLQLRAAGTPSSVLYMSTMVGGSNAVYFGASNLLAPAGLNSAVYSNLVVGKAGISIDANLAPLGYITTSASENAVTSTNMCLYTSSVVTTTFSPSNSNVSVMDFTMNTLYIKPNQDTQILQGKYASIQAGSISSFNNQYPDPTGTTIPPFGFIGYQAKTFGYISLAATVNNGIPTTAGLTVYASNVGIQCNIPRYTLDVNGLSHITNANATVSIPTLLIDGDTSHIHLGNGSATNIKNYMTINDVAGGTGQWIVGSQSVGGFGVGASVNTFVIGRLEGEYAAISLRRDGVNQNCVGINVGAPTLGPSFNYTLDVNGTIHSTRDIIVGDASQTTNSIKFLYTTTTAATDSGWGFGILGSNAAPASYLMFSPSTLMITHGGIGANEFPAMTWTRKAQNETYVGINTITVASVALDVVGTIRATVDVIVTSDERVKENIAAIAAPLSMVEGMRGVYYTLKADPSSIRKVGVIAQEIETVLPEVVHTSEGDEGMKAVSYGNITAVLIEGMKELNSTVKGLQTEVSTMKGN